MVLGLFLVSAGLLLLALAVLAYPLLFQSTEAYRSSEGVSTEFSERDALLEAMSELEVEYQSGKLSRADYESAKARYEGEYLALAGKQG
jgi:hypothetical protein